MKLVVPMVKSVVKSLAMLATTAVDHAFQDETCVFSPSFGGYSDAEGRL